MRSVPTATQKMYGTHAERLAINTESFATCINFYETDTGNTYEWEGDIWYRIKANRMPLSVQVIWNPVTLAYEVSAGGGGASGNLSGNGIAVANSPQTAAVSNSSGLVLAANGSRTGLVITNVGTDTVFFGCGAAAVLNSGIVLTAGGTWVMDPYTFTLTALYGIAATSSTLAIQEYQ